MTKMWTSVFMPTLTTENIRTNVLLVWILWTFFFSPHRRMHAMEKKLNLAEHQIKLNKASVVSAKSYQIAYRRNKIMNAVKRLHGAAKSGVPGPAGGQAGLLAGETQGDTLAVHCLQENS